MLHVLTATLGALIASAPSVAVQESSRHQVNEHPAAILTSAGLVVAWARRAPGRAEVVYAVARDISTFSAAVGASGPLDGPEIIRPSLAARGDRVVLTWADASRGDLDVYAVTSWDAGLTFSPPLLAAGGPGRQSDPRAAMLEDGTIVIAYSDSFGTTDANDGRRSRVRIVRAAPDAAFGAPQAIGAAAPDLVFDHFPDLDGAGTSTEPLSLTLLHARATGETEVHLHRSRDGGVSFDPAIVIDAPIERELGPRVAVARRGIIAVFDALLPIAGQEFASLVIRDPQALDVRGAFVEREASTPTSVTWNSTRTLDQDRADVAADGRHVVITYVDHSIPARPRLVARSSRDGGQSFGEEVALDDDAVSPDHPSVTVRGETAVIAFEDARGGSLDVRAIVWP